jgi:hypothetical protein
MSARFVRKRAKLVRSGAMLRCRESRKLVAGNGIF